MFDERVNAAIDEVAREMTEGSPTDAAAFRRQVLARIDAGAAPRRSWRAAFVLSPIAAAAAIVIAVMIVRGPGSAGPGVPTQPAARVAAAPPDAASASAAARPEERRASAGLAAVRRAGPSGSGRTGAPEEPALQIAPNEVASIAVAPLTVGALTPDPIAIDRLETIAPLIVAPLEIIDMQRRFE